MCCFKNYKNFERLNNLVQVAVNVAIKFIQSLPVGRDEEDAQSAKKPEQAKEEAKPAEKLTKQAKEGDVAPEEKKHVGQEETDPEKKQVFLTFYNHIFLYSQLFFVVQSPCRTFMNQLPMFCA